MDFRCFRLIGLLFMIQNVIHHTNGFELEHIYANEIKHAQLSYVAILDSKDGDENNAAEELNGVDADNTLNGLDKNSILGEISNDNTLKHANEETAIHKPHAPSRKIIGTKVNPFVNEESETNELVDSNRQEPSKETGRVNTLGTHHKHGVQWDNADQGGEKVHKTAGESKPKPFVQIDQPKGILETKPKEVTREHKPTAMNYEMQKGQDKQNSMGQYRNEYPSQDADTLRKYLSFNNGLSQDDIGDMDENKTDIFGHTHGHADNFVNEVNEKSETNELVDSNRQEPGKETGRVNTLGTHHKHGVQWNNADQGGGKVHKTAGESKPKPFVQIDQPKGILETKPKEVTKEHKPTDMNYEMQKGQDNQNSMGQYRNEYPSQDADTSRKYLSFNNGLSQDDIGDMDENKTDIFGHTHGHAVNLGNTDAHNENGMDKENTLGSDRQPSGDCGPNKALHLDGGLSQNGLHNLAKNNKAEVNVHQENASEPLTIFESNKNFGVQKDIGNKLTNVETYILFPNLQRRAEVADCTTPTTPCPTTTTQPTTCETTTTPCPTTTTTCPTTTTPCPTTTTPCPTTTTPCPTTTTPCPTTTTTCPTTTTPCPTTTTPCPTTTTTCPTTTTPCPTTTTTCPTTTTPCPTTTTPCPTTTTPCPTTTPAPTTASC